MAQALRETVVSGPDRRRITAYEGGDLDGEAVVVHSGTPGFGWLPARWTRDAQRRGLRLIGYDRPGYAGSDRSPGRRVVDAAADVTAVVDALGVRRFRTWGALGGGPYALACAAVLADRVVAAASVTGIAPSDAEGLAWIVGMDPPHVDELSAAVAGAATLHRWLAPTCAALLGRRTDGVLGGGEAAALSAGYDGWLDDDLAAVEPWGVDLATITAPVLVAHSPDEPSVPETHGVWLARHTPGATPHLGRAMDVGRLHTWLLDQGSISE